VRKDLIIVLGIVLLSAGIFLLGHFGVDPNILRVATLFIWLLIVALLSRRFRRSAPEVPWACHVAAANALFLGATTLIGGLGHSLAVASLALSEHEYGSLQMMRFTTGAMLVYSGAMTVAIYRAITAGRRSAIGLGAATALLFVLYLLFLLPLPGSGGTVSGMLGLWSIYLLSLGAAALASTRAHPVRLSFDAVA
jgi:hypothetical protein